MNKLKTIQKKEIAGAMLLLAIFVLPIISLAGEDDKIYVDDDASGKQTGSSTHPFKTISAALEDTDSHSEIHISNGIYRENIEVPKGVEIHGEDKYKTIIEAENDEDETVELNHKSEITKVTIRGGKQGIEIDEGDRASVIKCVIEDNKKDGIKIEKAPVKDKYKASISENIIRNNGGSGIYSEKRRLVVMDNTIIENDGDGIDIEGGSSVWIYKNLIKENDASGLKMTLDGSYIWTKNNTYRDNDREGIEINAYGNTGRIDINKSKFYKNDRYGITKVQRNYFNESIWDGLTIQDDNIFWENKKADISDKIKI